MYLLYVAPSTGKTGSASSAGNIRRIKMDPCGAGGATTEDMSVGQLREKVAEVLASQNQAEHGTSFKIIYCGRILKDETKKLKDHGISARSSIQVIPSLGEEGNEGRPVPTAITDEDLQQSFVAFTLAARNPNFTQTVAKAVRNFDDMCATVPGLDRDPVACAIITKPELLLSLKDQDTFKYVAEKHPALIEVANNLAALILESKQSVADNTSKETGGAGPAASNPLAYHLDDMSDDDYDDDDAMDTEGPAGAGGGGAGQPFQPISAEQLRAALSAANAFGGNPFGGVTGMGPSTGSRPAPPPTSSMQSPITQDQLAAALAAATGSSGSSSAAMTPGAAVPTSSAAAAAAANPFSFLNPQSSGSSAGNWDKEVAKMKEMGISDEELARKALRVMDGDIQAAIELIFSGWDGKDDSSN